MSAPPLLVAKPHVDAEAARAFDAFARIVHVVRAHEQGQPLDALALQRVAQACVDCVLDDPARRQRIWDAPTEALRQAFRAANCCFMSIVFGHHLGITNAQLRELALAAIVWGMRDSIRRDELLGTAQVYDRSWMIALQCELLGDQPCGAQIRGASGETVFAPARPMPLYAKIVAICGAFDRLTTAGSARSLSSNEALETMRANMPAHFEPELLRSFCVLAAA